MEKNPELSIVILSYNTEKILEDCLASVYRFSQGINFEALVVDNGSSDGSVTMVKNKFPEVKLVENKNNLGFARGNNLAREKVRGKYVLFLNSDVIATKDSLSKSLDYIKKHDDTGALSCKLTLPDGNPDKDARRSFPTPWVALTHFSGLDRLFPHSELFSKYWYLYKSSEKIQDVDVIEGAFFLTKKEILDSVDWFSEEYFLDGEDIDLCWKIKSKGLRIIYFPETTAIHLKGASKGKRKSSFLKVTREERIKVVNVGLDSMAIFYKKWLWRRYPLLLDWTVLAGINGLRFLRYLKALAY